jgi:hypothetical protein
MFTAFVIQVVAAEILHRLNRFVTTHKISEAQLSRYLGRRGYKTLSPEDMIHCLKSLGSNVTVAEVG